LPTAYFIGLNLGMANPGASDPVFEHPASEANYLVWKDGSTYYAKNGESGNIDYSGTVASTVIQAAIDALTSGGTVFLKQGTYTITAKISVTTNDISIIGEGDSTFLNSTINDTILEFVATAPNYLYDCWVKDLQIQGSKTAGVSQFGVKLKRCRRSGVINCFIQKSGHDGIYLLNSSYCVVANNIVQDCADDGINLNYATYNTIIGNVALDMTSDGIHIYLLSNFNSIVGNVVKGSGRYGIGVGDNVSPSDNNDITGNNIYSSTDSGIMLDDARTSTVAGNVIHTSARGIELKRAASKNTLSSNTIIASTNYGISLNSSDSNVIDGNVIDTVTNYDGIYLLDSDHTVITDNRIVACGDRSVEEAGTSDYTLLDGNNVNGNTTAHNVDAGNSVVGDIIT